MEGRGPEFAPEIVEKTDDGFSETKSAKVVEGKGMDKGGKKRKPVVPSSRFMRPMRTARPARTRPNQQAPLGPLSQKEKIIKAYQENAQALSGLVELLKTVDGTNLRQEEQLLDEIREKRHMQEELLNALLLEQRHQLTEDAISKEAWNLVK